MNKLFRILCAAFLVLLAIGNVHAQNKLYGVVTSGGNGGGVIYSTNADGSNYEVVHNFDFMPGMQPKGIIQASNGKFYGTASQNGGNNVKNKIFFQYDPVTEELKTWTNTYLTWGQLLEASDGHIYGLSDHHIFQFDITAQTLTDVANLSDIGLQTSYASLVEDANGKFYGTTSDGGANAEGGIFEFDPANGNLTKLYDFSGHRSIGGLVKGTNGKYYGITTSTDALYEFDLTDNSVSFLFTFTGSSGTHKGNYPIDELLVVGDKLYGGTIFGGANGGGVLFEYDYINDIYSILHEFNLSAINAPSGGLLLASNGKIYGHASSGGTNYRGGIFEYDITNSAYSVILEHNDTQGHNPNFNNIIQETDGYLYSMTSQGGSESKGMMFKYDLNNSIHTVLFNFGTSNEGHEPIAPLTLADNGKLYGTTAAGGLNGDGTIFEFDPATNQFTRKKHFERTSNGNSSYGKMLDVNGILYGTTYYGGAINRGVIFTYDYTNNVRSVIYEFSGTNGEQPASGLIMASNGLLYGTTTSGGTNSKGIIYTIDPTDNSFTKIHDFTDAFAPANELEIGNEGLLYGSTLYGGTNNGGVIFTVDPTDNSYQKLADLIDYPLGDELISGLTKAFNGKYYGTPRRGGSNSAGTLIEFDPITNSITKKVNFGGDKGGKPSAKLLLSSNGNLYGVTREEGANGLGTFYEYNPYENVFTKLLDFNKNNGASPLLTGLTEVFATNVPAITYEPEPEQLPCQGETLELMVFTSGPDITYQWKKDGVDIAGATSSIFRIENITDAANGAYTCVVSNSYGNATSTASTVTVTNPPIVSLEPIADKTFGDASFDVVTNATGGDGPIITSSNTNVATVSGTTITIVGGGTTTITATSSNSCFTVTATQQLLVNKQDHTLTFDPISTVTYGDADITLSASSSAGVPVTFTSSDETIMTVSGDVLSIVGSGTATITASSENNNYNLAQATQDVTVNKADQTIEFDALPVLGIGEVYTLTANADSQLTVTFSSSDPSIASIDGNLLDIHAFGEVIITASQAGDANYNPATATQSLTISTITSTDEVLSNKTILYPNPVNSILNVLINNAEYENLVIYSAIGEEVLRKSISYSAETQQLNLNSLKNGVYILELSGDTATEKIRFIKSN